MVGLCPLVRSGKETDMVEVEIKLSPSDLYDFNLKHSYSKPAGILATAVGLVGVAYGLYAKYWLLLIVGAILVVYTPIVLLIKANQAYALSPAMKKPFKYTFDENGITISQDDKSENHPWDSMVKAISTGKSIIVYTTRYNATIIPKAQAGESLPLVIKAISEGIDPKKNKIRS